MDKNSSFARLDDLPRFLDARAVLSWLCSVRCPSSCPWHSNTYVLFSWLFRYWHIRRRPADDYWNQWPYILVPQEFPTPSRFTLNRETRADRDQNTPWAPESACAIPPPRRDRSPRV